MDKMVEKKMEEKIVEQEVRFYCKAILAVVARVDPPFSWLKEAPELVAHFEGLSRSDVTLFREVCARLLVDKKREVRLGILNMFRYCNVRDDALSLLLIKIAFEEKDLREKALYALARVGTRRVLPQLFFFAKEGYAPALYLVRQMAQTPEEIERGIEIAHKYIAAGEYRLRETALFLLQKFSSMEREAERVLMVVQKYKDESFIEALKKAPPEMVLEPLKELRATIGEEYAEYNDLTWTIDVLEQKMRGSDEQEKKAK